MNRKHKIELVCNCTPQEHEKAWFTVQYRCGILRFWPFVFLASLLLIGNVAYMLLTKHIETKFWSVILFSCMAIAIPLVYFSMVIPYVNKRRHYYLEKYMTIGERTLTVFSHSISIGSKIVSSDIPFSDCKFFLDKKDYLLLIQNRRSYLIIPKRDVPEKEMQELKKRLKRGSVWYRAFHRG